MKSASDLVSCHRKLLWIGSCDTDVETKVPEVEPSAKGGKGGTRQLSAALVCSEGTHCQNGILHHWMRHSW